MSRKRKGRVNRDGVVTSRTEDFGAWYSEVCNRAGLIEYYDVSGCYILRPLAYSIWESIQSYFDARIKASGVRNCYFPLFVTEDKLRREEENFEGFKAEVAWVTRSGDKELPEPIAVRPTSETVMYPYYAKWIRSHRDLPLRLNQWANVVRWEFSHPCPFIRSREFLWQEGHSAFATKKESDEEVLEILNLYKQTYEDLLAVPVIRGMKTEKEKFPGGNYTTTVEAFVACNGRSIQAATSHSLGQNFARMFEITFEDEQKETRFAWQNSWGLSTRSIGAVIMVHGDDDGLILPPKVSPDQVVIVPIIFEAVADQITAKCEEVRSALTAVGIRTRFDDRTERTPGWKFNYWELRGVPIRLEIGPRDLRSNCCVLVRRDTKEKIRGVPSDESLPERVAELLETIHTAMFEKARAERDAHIIKVTQWDDFMPNLDQKNLLLVPFCGGVECEEAIKLMTKEQSSLDATNPLSGAAKSLCVPIVQDEVPEGTACVNPTCPGGADCRLRWTLFGRSY